MEKRTNIELDMAALGKAKRILGTETAKETVNTALARIVGTAKALKGLVGLKGKVQFNKGYDYKGHR